MTWWAWVILGLCLMLAEFLTPGALYFPFFGVGAIVVGLLALIGFGGPEWLQWLLFSVLSVASVALFRRRLVARFKLRRAAQSEDLDTLVGKTALALEPIPAGSVGKVEMRGTPWNARNLDPQPLNCGQRCTVKQVNGLVLDVAAEASEAPVVERSHV